MSDISEQLENLSPQEKRALLAKLLREKVGDVTSSYPLSYGQQALWFLYQSAPESAAYNTAFTARIRSQVNVPALRRAFQALIDRHPSLRTTFKTIDGKLVQEVHGYQEICFEQIDASSWTWEELQNQVVETYRHPFNLEQEPVMRVNLLTRSDRDHVLLITIHHIVFDGWSLWIILDELRTLYPAEKKGKQSSLPPLRATYADYVRKQSEILESSVGQRLWNYWKQHLSGELPVLNLPTEHPRPSVQTYNGASHPFKLSGELTQRLKALAQTEGATLYMVLLAAFQVLLYRYSGQEDILVGSPVTGRTQTEFAGVVGYFVNMLVLRADLSGDPSFKIFLNQVRRTVMAAFEHQDYPFPLLVEKLQPIRDPSRSPLFQAAFVLQKPQQFKEIIHSLVSDETKTRVNWGDLELEPFEMAQQEGQFDLTLEMLETKEKLVAVFDYNTDLFDTVTIQRMIGHFQTLLEGIITNPEQRLLELTILAEAEKHQLLIEWNDTERKYPKEKSLHELFEKQATQIPDAVAVIFEDKQLTYVELNRRADQLAHYLRSLGVGPEALVAICMERSIEMLVGLLGILKAGAAYVPIAPVNPQERIRFIVENTQAQVLLTQQSLLTHLPGFPIQRVCLDTDWDMIAPHPSVSPVCKALPGNIAYVIYTSGSTGQPKGAMISHQAVVNRTMAVMKSYELAAYDRVLQFASLSFDVSLEEIFPSLCSGVTVVLRPVQEPLSFEEFISFVEQKHLTIVNLPTAYWHEWVNLLSRDQTSLPASLRLVIVGTERASANHLSIWQRLVGGNIRWINAYGPTEATITTTMYELAINRNNDNISSVPIGRPLANTQVYILDQNLHPVPIGVSGELYIGGDSLARGYLNRPELTAEKFIPDPFSNEPGVRLYRTGDLVRYLSDANIEFLGRTDFQVKIRGFRVELGEIEAVLTGHEVVKEAIVVAREEQAGDKRLVAYLVLETGNRNLETGTWKPELRDYLMKKFPNHMIPSAFMILDTLPLSPSGKVNRRALPLPQRRTLREKFIAPRTSTEQVLAEIWREVLNLEQVGIFDNFFELGGHSLLATQIISRIRQEFRLELPLHHLFEEPTIANLAEFIETIQRLTEPSKEFSSDLTEEEIIL